MSSPETTVWHLADAHVGVTDGTKCLELIFAAADPGNDPNPEAIAAAAEAVQVHGATGLDKTPAFRVYLKAKQGHAEAEKLVDECRQNLAARSAEPIADVLEARAKLQKAVERCAAAGERLTAATRGLDVELDRRIAAACTPAAVVLRQRAQELAARAIRAKDLEEIATALAAVRVLGGHRRLVRSKFAAGLLEVLMGQSQEEGIEA